MIKEKRVMVTVGLTEEVINEIDLQARKETRTRSNLITKVISNYVTETKKAEASSSQLTSA